MAKGKLNAPAKSLKGGAGPMRTGKAGDNKPGHLFGGPLSGAPVPADLGDGCCAPGDSNGSDSDDGLHREARNKSAAAGAHVRKKGSESLLK